MRIRCVIESARVVPSMTHEVEFILKCDSFSKQGIWLTIPSCSSTIERPLNGHMTSSRKNSIDIGQKAGQKLLNVRSLEYYQRTLQQLAGHPQ